MKILVIMAMKMVVLWVAIMLLVGKIKVMLEVQLMKVVQKPRGLHFLVQLSTSSASCAAPLPNRPWIVAIVKILSMITMIMMFTSWGVR